jgi:hypothetical protein
MRKAVERGESDRKRLANELATYHANDETRVAEVERRLIRWERTTHDELNQKLEDTVGKQQLDGARLEERVLQEVGSVEKRISARLDDCFAQLSTSLDLYKNMRSLCKDAGERARGTEDAVAEQFQRLEAQLDFKVPPAMSAYHSGVSDRPLLCCAARAGGSRKRRKGRSAGAASALGH